MNVVLLNIKEVRQIKDQLLTVGNWFNPIIDKFGNVVISEEEIKQITNPNFDWLKSKQIISYTDIAKDIDYTLPKSNGIGLVIAAKWQWIFPIKLNGFQIDLKNNGSQFYVEDSAVKWTDFQNELKKSQNNDFRELLLPLIDYLKNTATKISV